MTEHAAEYVKREGLFLFYKCAGCGANLPPQMWAKKAGETDDKAIHRLAAQAALSSECPSPLPEQLA
jgi:hypothetical protein